MQPRDGEQVSQSGARELLADFGREVGAAADDQRIDQGRAAAEQGRRPLGHRAPQRAPPPRLGIHQSHVARHEQAPLGGTDPAPGDDPRSAPAGRPPGRPADAQAAAAGALLDRRRHHTAVRPDAVEQPDARSPGRSGRTGRPLRPGRAPPPPARAVTVEPRRRAVQQTRDGRRRACRGHGRPSRHEAATDDQHDRRHHSRKRGEADPQAGPEQHRDPQNGRPHGPPSGD